MKLQPVLKKEIRRIALGVCLCLLVMNGVYFAIWHKQYDFTVLWGSILGSIYAIGNFVYQAFSVQRAIHAGQSGAALLRKSYALRMLGIVALLVLAYVIPCFHVLATAIPLLFPRITIFVMQLFGLYNPDALTEKEETGRE